MQEIRKGVAAVADPPSEGALWRVGWLHGSHGQDSM